MTAIASPLWSAIFRRAACENREAVVTKSTAELSGFMIATSAVVKSSVA